MASPPNMLARPYVSPKLTSPSARPWVEELALIDAIHADPRNDVPRLAYADWLAENDEHEHAEFIRLQCQKPYVVISNRDPDNPGQSFSFEFPYGDLSARARLARLLEIFPAVWACAGRQKGSGARDQSGHSQFSLANPGHERLAELITLATDLASSRRPSFGEPEAFRLRQISPKPLTGLAPSRRVEITP